MSGGGGAKGRHGMIALDRILPTRPVSADLLSGERFRLVAGSIAELGMIEPLVVVPIRGAGRAPRRSRLIDGHLRHAVLKDRGEPRARCLITEGGR